jgi:fervidolysin-like protein
MWRSIGSVDPILDEVIRAMGGIVAAVALGGMLSSGCGSSGAPQPASVPAHGGGNRGTFVACSGAAGGAPGYAIVDAPGADCRPLVAGQDYADGRVIIGLKPGTTDAQLDQALADYKATVVSSQPTLGDRVLAVPNGSVPQAVVGLAHYSFIAFAAPDMIAHIDQNKT